MIIRKGFVNDIMSRLFRVTVFNFDLVDLICGAQSKGTASACRLVDVLGVDEVVSIPRIFLEEWESRQKNSWRKPSLV